MFNSVILILITAHISSIGSRFPHWLRYGEICSARKPVSNRHHIYQSHLVSVTNSYNRFYSIWTVSRKKLPNADGMWSNYASLWVQLLSFPRISMCLTYATSNSFQHHMSVWSTVRLSAFVRMRHSDFQEFHGISDSPSFHNLWLALAVLFPADIWLISFGYEVFNITLIWCFIDTLVIVTLRWHICDSVIPWRRW